MPVDAGRRAPETPEEDWVLLREFGFIPPADKEPNTNYVDAAPSSVEVFPKNTKPFRLREFWASTDQPDQQVIATFQGDSKRPAITWKPFGKGRIVVVWASTIVPAAAEGYPLLRDIARWAGIAIHDEGTPASLWTNLLRDEAKDRYYGLVYRSSYPGGSDRPAIDGVTRWHLPAGDYKVTEMISDREIGTRTAALLKDEGLAAKFNPYEVAVYRIEKTSPR